MVPYRRGGRVPGLRQRVNAPVSVTAMVVRNAPVITQVTHDVEPVRVEVVDARDVTPRMRRVRFRATTTGAVAALSVAAPAPLPSPSLRSSRSSP